MTSLNRELILKKLAKADRLPNGDMKIAFAMFQEAPAAAGVNYYLKALTLVSPPDVSDVGIAGNSGRIAVTTSVPHGYSTGETVRLFNIAGIAGTPDLNNAFTIEKYNDTVFKLNGTNGLNYTGTYTPGGTCRKDLRAYLGRRSLVVMELKR